MRRVRKEEGRWRGGGGEVEDEKGEEGGGEVEGKRRGGGGEMEDEKGEEGEKEDTQSHAEVCSSPRTRANVLGRGLDA